MLSRAHCAMATKERIPPSTAHTDITSTVASRWRTPRRLRGSGTAARTCINDTTCEVLGTDSPSAIRPRSWPRTGLIGKDATAGMTVLDVNWLA